MLKTQPLHHGHPARVLQAGHGGNVPFHGCVPWKIRSELGRRQGMPAFLTLLSVQWLCSRHTVRPFCWRISQFLLTWLYLPSRGYAQHGAALTGGMVGYMCPCLEPGVLLAASRCSAFQTLQNCLSLSSMRQLLVSLTLNSCSSTQLSRRCERESSKTLFQLKKEPVHVNQVSI